MTPRAVLVGLPGSGKTTTGRRLARRLRASFADSDDLIEQSVRRSVPDILSSDGEPAFRAIEAAVVTDALRTFDGVLSLGGGAVTTDSVRAALKESGVQVVYLRADLRALVGRVKGGKGRPLLAGDARTRLTELGAVRDPMYREVATMTVDTANRGTFQVAAQLARMIQKAEKA